MNFINVWDKNKIKKGIDELCRNRLFYLSRILNYPLLQPEVLQITMTNRCNLSCRMCFVSHYVTKPEEEMPVSQILDLIDQAKNMGVRTVVLSGGEPFLREDIYDIFKHCSKKGIWTVVTTNGTLLENKLEKIIASKASHLHFSVDGLEETHDYIRGEGSFKKVVGAIRKIADFKYKTGQGPSTSLACVIMKRNIDDLPGMFRLADELKMDVFDPLPLLPDNTDFTEFQNKNVADLVLNSEADALRLKEAFKEISNIRAKYVKLNPSFNLPLFEKYCSRRLKSCHWKCFAGYKTIFITLSDPDRSGKKVPCIFMCKGHIILGGDIRSLWFSKKASQLRKEIKGCRTFCFQPCFYIPKFFHLIKSKLKTGNLYSDDKKGKSIG